MYSNTGLETRAHSRTVRTGTDLNEKTQLAFSFKNMLANRMTPATPITKRDEIKSAEEGFLYKCRTAVYQVLPATQNDGRCRI